MKIRILLAILCYQLIALPLKHYVLASNKQKTSSIFFVGNSFTRDCVPWKLDGSVDFHLSPGKTLEWIYKNPNKFLMRKEVTGMVESVSWLKALKENQYDYVFVQPFGSILVNDFDNQANLVAILTGGWITKAKEKVLFIEKEDSLMYLQPNAQFVVHTGWAALDEFEEAWHQKIDNGTISYCDAWFKNLIFTVEKKTGRKLLNTYTANILDDIYHDIEVNKAPFESMQELYSMDKLHLRRFTKKASIARYLAHHSLRAVLKLPVNDEDFSGLDGRQTQYIHSKISKYHKVTWLEKLINQAKQLLN